MADNAIHKSAAKKILNKLNPVHHKDKENHSNGPDDTAEVHHTPDVTDDVKPLVEQTNHVHSQTKHPTVESYVGSGLHGGIKEFLNSMNDEEAVGVISNLVRVQAVVGTGAAVREGLMALGDDKARDVVGKLIAAQATVFAECSMTPVSRQAAREGAMEAVTGSYDAVQKKFAEAPRFVAAAGVLGFLFITPLVISLWRFALFGLN